MTERNIVLVVHIVGAIMFLGPVTVATSLFPRYARLGEWAVAEALHRISRGYGMLTLIVPAAGLYLAARIGAFDQMWVNLSMALFIAAFVLLLGFIVPRQARLLANRDGGESSRTGVAGLSAGAGLFGMTWLVILYLMVAKPG